MLINVKILKMDTSVVWYNGNTLTTRQTQHSYASITNVCKTVNILLVLKKIFCHCGVAFKWDKVQIFISFNE